MSNAAYVVGDFVEIVGAADFNGVEGEVAWFDHETNRVGVWIDKDDEPPQTMPITFLTTEVRLVAGA